MTVLSNTSPELSGLLDTLTDAHIGLQRHAARSVDTALVARNWLFGHYIVEFEQGASARAAMYGKQLIDQLAKGLTARGISGVAVTSLKLCRMFYLAYKKIGQTLSDQSFSLTSDATQALAISPTQLSMLSAKFKLGWSHYVVLLTITNTAERSFYEIEAQANSWGIRELKRQLASSLYERLALSRDPGQIKALAQEGQVVARPADVLKSPFVLEFLDLPAHPGYSEHELEAAIIDRLEHFLLELGKGFLFEARQKRFTFDDEAPTIGIVLCHSKNDALVELTLPANANIYASPYQLYLPSKDELLAQIEAVVQEVAVQP